MSNDFNFESEHLRFSKTEIHLLRSRFPYKKILFSKVKKLRIKKGTRTKRPILLFILGAIILCLTATFFLSTNFSQDFLRFEDTTVDNYSAGVAKALGAWILFIGFMLSFGVVAVFYALFPTWILKLELQDGSSEIFGIRSIMERDDRLEFIDFVKSKFENHQIEIHRNFN